MSLTGPEERCNDGKNGQKEKKGKKGWIRKEIINTMDDVSILLRLEVGFLSPFPT